MDFPADQENLPSSESLNHNTDQLSLKFRDKADEKEVAGKVSEDEIQTLLSNIFSPDYETKETALSNLRKAAQPAAQCLVNILVKDPTDATATFQIIYALEEIGKTAIAPLLDALKQIEDFKKPADIARLANIAEALIRLNDKSAAGYLVQQINKVGQETKRILGQGNNSSAAKTSTGNGRELNLDTATRKKLELHQTAQLKIHSLLGEMGIKEGMNDLLFLLGNGRNRVHSDIIEALSKIGDKKSLVPLIRLYSIESNISELGARFIKFTFREIVRREKTSKTDPVFNRLSSEERENLDKLFPRQRNNH